MRPGNGAPSRVALSSAALSALYASNGNGRAALYSQVEPRISPIPAPDPKTRVSVSH